MTREALLEEIADAILDGTPIDWTAIEGSAPPLDEPLVDQLKTLSALRRVPRTGPPQETCGRWGHLQLFERIGHGAYGDVHRAWDLRLDREVALKLLPAGVDSAGSSESAVIDEGRLLARVRHPNVVTIYGAERIEGRIGLWMELVKGRTLEQRLQQRDTFAAANVVKIGIDLCQAVSAVHAAGLLHRDIKAQNVMLEDGGRLVLMDFGTGRELDGATDVQVAGTPLYLAPEVLSGEQATPQSDVYSIGVLLFRLLTASYPVTGRDLAELRRAHAASVADTRRHPEIPVRLRRVLTRALDPDPHRRYAGPEALGAALASLGRISRVRRAAYAAASVAMLVMLVAGGWNLGLREVFTRTSAAAPSASTPAIAVLPFRNASSDAGNDDFVDGLTSEVIRNLAAIDGLQVRSQTSSFFFKDLPRDLREIADQLHVNLIVEASVHRADGRLRITAQLVRIPDDVLVWSERFDREIEDVFAIQDEISRTIVGKLRLTLGRGRRRYRTDLAAYDLYLRGRAMVARRGTDSAEEAVRLFREVISIDPEFAPAHAGLADAYATMSWAIEGLDPATALAGMRPAAVKALELDPDLAEAHAAMGTTYAREFEWDRARASFERAIALSPNLSEIRTSYWISTLLPQGDVARALDILTVARNSDPLSLSVKREIGIALFFAGRYEEAIAILRQVIAADPDFTYAANVLARALTFAGRPEEAIALYQSRPEHRPWERWLMPAYVRVGRRDDIDRLLNDLSNAQPYRQELIHAALGDKDRTFAALDRAASVVPQRTAAVLSYPEMQLLRGDPRLDELRRRFHLR